MDKWNRNFSQRKPIVLSNPHNLTRINEPVLVEIKFKEKVHPNSLRVVSPEGKEIPSQLYDIELEQGYLKSARLAFLASVEGLEVTYWLYFDEKDCGQPDYQGIKQLQPELEDGVKRLDTGHYVLELCRGKADGTAAGKWGIRYFEAKSQGLNLIKDCSNAIGGFYGPFFTPSNGLINPPEHTKVEIITEVEGPIYCRYRFKGTVPPGLDPNLRDKDFEIIWHFFYKTPWFIRKYIVDEYSTVIDGMPVTNKITVGDEFEAGQGKTVLPLFGTYGGTYYRTGDCYAQILAREVNELLQLPETEAPAGLKKFKEIIGDDISRVSWDYYWRLFCVEEGVLSEQEILKHSQEIIKKAHQAVHKSERKDNILYGKLIDVSSKTDQTIFPLNAKKTVEYNPDNGYAMVWYTSSSVARYQIVQRPASGWGNWGTNGENEYPELPIGSTIYSAYDQFVDWEKEADKMEYPLEPKVGMTEQVTLKKTH